MVFLLNVLRIFLIGETVSDSKLIKTLIYHKCTILTLYTYYLCKKTINISIHMLRN